jgi:hypothetical protein
MVSSVRFGSAACVSALLLALAGCGGGGAGGSGGTTPSLKLTASPAGVPRGGSTTLSWTSSNATACTASGGWIGAKSPSGTETTAPLTSDQTYQLSCTGPMGNMLSMTTVTVRAAIVSWDAPTQNSDGSQITDLNGFKVRWGAAPHSYTFSASVAGATTTSYETALDPGTWYFSVTAVNAAGQESAPSNEVARTVL